MAYTLDLQAHGTVSNGLALDAGLRDRAKNFVKPDLGLRIARYADDKLEFTLCGALIESDYPQISGLSSRPAAEFFSRIDDCRQAWKTGIVDLTAETEDPETYRKRAAMPFQDGWDFASRPELLAAAAPALAVAGDKLFNAIFESKGDAGLGVVAQMLRQGLASQDCTLAVTSADLFVPWGLLYTHPVGGEKLKADGSNWRKEGFWGYRHIVHQNPDQFPGQEKARFDPTAAGFLSVNFDDRLAATFAQAGIDEHIRQIAELVAEPRIRRTRKAELALGFTEQRDRLERILYFYCHGHGSTTGGGANADDPRLTLSDDDVKATDFEYWSDGKTLPTNPLIFINACQGGQMQTLFYKSFAVELLRQGAAGLVGAQIDVPAVFGVEYGKRVLGGFFARADAPVRLGRLMREVNRALWDQHANPLGLIYSLYRGVNCFIDWPAAAEPAV